MIVSQLEAASQICKEVGEGPFTLSEDQRTFTKDQSVSGKHQRKFSLSLNVNGPLKACSQCLH